MPATRPEGKGTTRPAESPRNLRPKSCLSDVSGSVTVGPGTDTGGVTDGGAGQNNSSSGSGKGAAGSRGRDIGGSGSPSREAEQDLS